MNENSFIEAAFLAFYKDSGLKLNERDMLAVRMPFYAGAAHMLDKLGKMIDPKASPTDNMQKISMTVLTESIQIKEFANMVKAGRKS